MNKIFNIDFLVRKNKEKEFLKSLEYLERLGIIIKYETILEEEESK